MNVRIEIFLRQKRDDLFENIIFSIKIFFREQQNKRKHRSSLESKLRVVVPQFLLGNIMNYILVLVCHGHRDDDDTRPQLWMKEEQK